MIKNIRLLLLGLLLLNLSQNNSWAVDYTQDVNCVGAWLFTGTGTSISDSSGNSHTQNFKGAGEPVWDTDNKPPNTEASAEFDGDDDYIRTYPTSGFPTGNDSRTHTIWVNFENLSSKRVFCGSRSDFTMAHDPTWGVYLESYGATQSNYTLSTDTWYFIVFVYDGTTVTYYVNGTSVGSDTTYDGWVGGNLADHMNTSYKYDEWAITQRGFPGQRSSDTSIFDRTITSTEINEIYDYGLKGQTNPIQLNLILNNSIFNNVQLN